MTMHMHDVLGVDLTVRYDNVSGGGVVGYDSYPYMCVMFVVLFYFIFI